MSEYAIFFTGESGRGPYLNMDKMERHKKNDLLANSVLLSKQFNLLNKFV